MLAFLVLRGYKIMLIGKIISILKNNSVVVEAETKKYPYVLESHKDRKIGDTVSIEETKKFKINITMETKNEN